MSATDLAAKLGVTLVTNLCDLVARYFPEPVGHDFDEAAERDLVEREAEQEVAPGRDLFAEHAAHCQGCAAADTDSPDPDSGDADAPAPRTSPTSVPGSDERHLLQAAISALASTVVAHWITQHESLGPLECKCGRIFHFESDWRDHFGDVAHDAIVGHN